MVAIVLGHSPPGEYPGGECPNPMEKRRKLQWQLQILQTPSVGDGDGTRMPGHQ